jgi:hypothetical protein
LPEFVRERIANIVESVRKHLAGKMELDPRSLFDLDEYLIELMDRVEESTADGREIPPCLLQEVTDYLEAFRMKVDHIAGYWRCQESISRDLRARNRAS